MTVAQRDVLDHLLANVAGNQFTMVMIEDRELSDDDGLLDDTTAKMNAYLHMIVSGQLTRLDPRTASASVGVAYHTLDDPTQHPELMKLLSAATFMFQKNDIDFVVRQLSWQAET